MKKFLPLILIGAGVLIVLVAGILLIRRGKGETGPEDAAKIPELPQSQWPAVTLTPTEDPKVPNSLGHFLDMKIQKVNVPGAASMDYLLVYTTSDGGQQGVPGTVKLTGSDIERKLLLGSESSGKFRFDAGVETGTLTITFRNAKGKSMGKLATDFRLQTGEKELTSVDGKFSYTLDKVPKGVFFITMPTFIEPDKSLYVVWKNGYGVFASDGEKHSGTASE
ncbi:MAG TPA: hypothetical protein VJ227_02290 [Patescibacteria group bacterium]|nr:hypothetical protein [Patescibacteria group bacterium]